MSSAREFAFQINNLDQHADISTVIAMIEARDAALLRDERERLNEVRKLAEESLRMRGVDKDKLLAILDRKLDEAHRKESQ